MNSKMQFTNWCNCHLKELPGGIKRRVISTDNIMVVQYLYEPNAVFPAHQHPQEQIVLVEKGELEFWVESEENKFYLKAGSILTIPGNISHGARVHGSKSVESINIFHPIKEEFLSEAEEKSITEQKEVFKDKKAQ